MTSWIYEWVDTELFTWTDSYEPAWAMDYIGLLRAIHTDSTYVYAAYSNGLIIIDISTEKKIAYIDFTYGFTTVCGDDTAIYLGTSYDGVFCLEKSSVFGSYTDQQDLSDKLFSADLRFPLQSSNILHLFVESNNLSIVTVEGVDIINFSDQGYRSYLTLPGVTKSFLTSKKELYYISYTDAWRLNKINTVLCDWQSPDLSYESGKSFMSDEVTINDVFVTENTSKLDNFNTLFIATSDGCYIYDEGTKECEIYYNKGHI